ncbi:hypothetical protein BDR07DRAFT_1499192 [Suillus spraguei]|nr:hypothetical protein BDR07DRAFT_1499192 [Suillus spraguei]
MLGTHEQVKSHHEAKEAKNRHKLHMEFEVEMEQVQQAKDAEIEQHKAEIERVCQAKDAKMEQQKAEIEQLRARLAALEG